MNLLVQCPCGQPLRLREEDLGGRVRCPSCAAVLVLPAPLESPPPPVVDSAGDARPSSSQPGPAVAYWLLAGPTPSGPFDASGIAARLAAGGANADTPCCPAGEAAWRPLREVLELAARLPAAPAPPPLPASSSVAARPPAEDEHPRGPELWNPDAAACWTLLFTPVFGMLLHAANWRALGRPERARANLAWAWTTVAAIVLGFGTVFLDDPSTATACLRFVMVAILIGWYFSEAKTQVRHVKARFPGGYARKSWIAPLAIGSAVLAAFVAASVLAARFEKPNPERLAAMVKDRILKEWRKQPALEDARIERIVLVHKNGKTYAGFLDMAVGDEKARFAVEVVVDGSRILWEVKPISP